MTEEVTAGEATTEPIEGQENDLIRSLRAQIDASKSEAKAAHTDADKRVEAVRAEITRDAEATTIVNALGFPKMAKVVASNVDGELSQETVAAYLVSLGLAQAGPETPGEKPGEGPNVPVVVAPVATPGAVQTVADLGSILADAASGDQATDLAKRIGEADSPEAVAALAAEGGFLQ